MLLDAGVRAVAAAAARDGAGRLMLVAPLAAWQQVSAASRMLPEGLELELARLPIDIVIILRTAIEDAKLGGGPARRCLGRFTRTRVFGTRRRNEVGRLRKERHDRVVVDHCILLDERRSRARSIQLENLGVWRHRCGSTRIRTERRQFARDDERRPITDPRESL